MFSAHLCDLKSRHTTVISFFVTIVIHFKFGQRVEVHLVNQMKIMEMDFYNCVAFIILKQMSGYINS